MSDNPHYPVSTAAINWFDSADQVRSRVYSSDGYNVIERCHDGDGWTTSQFKQPGRHVSAMQWTIGDMTFIRVYCTSDGTTTEWCWDSLTEWTKGSYTPV